ncbi:hypothetical protein IEK_05287 [Bacillus toyonensis]|uniref:hypothetical protein n=1 Tax=Bacillus toyonensis TaxID=155322 RepID=UPI00027BEBFE|nr:hypothetical protein [Bacillus toyonensis]EJV43948.1 hypothetical protein IEK_05287 [Bacillus toyonensis]PED97862.1 hypothetical protein CON78_24865 [Bacillus toyonensis]PEN79347.1 hypothetical protein CN544_22335 [Bacillus toyonensis]PHD30909.1 hypothetical protein COF48_27910 [Bacillus toyonensis]
MEEIQCYEGFINNIAQTKEWNDQDLLTYLLDEFTTKPENANKVIEIRAKLITTEERECILKSYFYLKVTFSFLEDENQLAAIATFLDILHESKKYFFPLSFEEYNNSQPIFQGEPKLLDYIRKSQTGKLDHELLQLKAIQFKPLPNNPNYRTCKYNNSFLQTSRYLDSRIPRYLIDNYGIEKIHIRLEPYYISDNLPRFSLTEEFLQPPNPKWLKNLKMHHNQKEGCQLFIPELTPSDLQGDSKKVKQFNEYHKLKLRKFETIAIMRNENGKKHFSMSLEELSKEKDGILIGRMIHLDSLDSYNTPFDKIRLNHLDLAINVYNDTKKDERLNCSLSEGGVVTSASYRTHLIRIDDIMFSDLIHIARLFFKSETMVEEWISTQFEQV